MSCTKEKLLLQEKPDLCLFVGDVTSTMACAISTQKLHVKVAQVEGGIRSGDWKMPEEINRIVNNSFPNYFFTTTELAIQNLRKTGVKDDRIYLVGNTMIDTLLKHKPHFHKPPILNEINLVTGSYLVMTLHRPANVDEEGNLKTLIDKVIAYSGDRPLIFPVHPRTSDIIKNLGLTHPRLHMIEPMGYLECNYLVQHCKAVITDSGGITEEITVMGIPCMTLCDNTERPETITIGTNELIGANPKAIKPAMEKLFSGERKEGSTLKFRDGKTTERIVKILLNLDLQ